MKTTAQIISLLALAGTVVPSILFFLDSMELPVLKTWMIVATIAWFVSATLWMEHKPTD